MSFFFIIKVHWRDIMLGQKLMRLRKKQGYSQQEVADLLSVTRQTISNWESEQGVPGIDKAKMLAQLYNVSLDDLAENDVEVVTKEKSYKDLHLLSYLIGKTCILECYDSSLLFDTSNGSEVKIIDVNEDWIKVEYQRTASHSLFKKESVIKLIDLSDVNGFEIMEEDL